MICFFAHRFVRVWTQACNIIKWCDALSYRVLFENYMVSQHQYFEHDRFFISWWFLVFLKFRVRVLNVLKQCMFWFSRFSFVNCTGVTIYFFVLNFWYVLSVWNCLVKLFLHTVFAESENNIANVFNCAKHFLMGFYFQKYMVSQDKYFEHVWLVISLGFRKYF